MSNWPSTSIPAFRSRLASIVSAGLLVASGALMSPSANAQHLHAGDIVPSLSNGQLVITNGHIAGNGWKLFEGNFRDLTLGLFGTRNPGFDSAPDTFQAGSQIWYRGVGTLGFWNGSMWGNAPLGSEIRVTDSLGSIATFSGLGVSQPEGVIDEVVAGQEVHQHVRFDLFPQNDSSIGAYLIALQLISRTGNGTAPGPHRDSDPFYIAFNAGLLEDDFERSVDAVGAVAQIPVPPAIALMLGGIAVLGAAGVRRRRAA